MAEPFFILLDQDLDSWLTDHFSISPDDNRYTMNKQAATLRARAKITSHFKRRCILPGGVAKVRNMPDIPALSRLARQVPQHFKFVNLFLREPLV